MLKEEIIQPKEIGSKYGLNIPLVMRAQWKALRGKKKWDLWVPIPYVKLSYTGSKQCHSLLDCAEIMQNVQKSYQDKGLGDLPWNFAISSEGYVYQGRGWYTEPVIPEHLKWLKGNMLDIAFIGDYKFDDPTWLMQNLALELIEYGVLTGILKPNFRIIPYREKQTSQPGSTT
ncbi:peptidoglycan recognition protein 1-like [Macrosteles quadrilineatus]|uniref:peptidoglycan recognition protein 1-like n=1 Tax=Macrosteles quadrilineatus TaxID=74068 RepID=UPI0023E210B8|nr:peptidoglycan recognition protein 1-like [Macrosteles quadrilineatus]